MRVILFALPFFALFGCSNERISRDREARLVPVIAYVEQFVRDNGRLPSVDEFRLVTGRMESIPMVLLDRSHPYAANKGAKNEKDFMIGIWRADWFHYYRSWDHQFLNGADEKN